MCVCVLRVVQNVYHSHIHMDACRVDVHMHQCQHAHAHAWIGLGGAILLFVSVVKLDASFASMGIHLNVNFTENSHLVIEHFAEG